MYESQVSEYKMDIERLSRELQEVKKKYFLQKKKDHMQRSVNSVGVKCGTSVNILSAMVGRRKEHWHKDCPLPSCLSPRQICQSSLEEGSTSNTPSRQWPSYLYLVAHSAESHLLQLTGVHVCTSMYYTI